MNLSIDFTSSEVWMCPFLQKQVFGLLTFAENGGMSRCGGVSGETDVAFSTRVQL